MKKKVCYYLGAGASALAIPVVSGIHDELIKFREMISQQPISTAKPRFKTALPIDSKAVNDMLLASCDRIIQNTQDQQSIDTYIRYLHHEGKHNAAKQQEAIEAKAVLTAFFIQIQMDNPADRRYAQFLNSIKDPGLPLPENVKVVSWNYDFQWEKAVGGDDIMEARSTLNVCTAASGVVSEDSFSVYKLNGTTDAYIDGQYAMLHGLARSYGQFSHLERIMSIYMTLIEPTRAQPLLSFAWEAEATNRRSFLDDVRSKVAESDTLVVIGYSFPFYNADIDKNLLRDMQSIQTIYIQDPNPENIQDRLLRVAPHLTPAKAELIRNTNDFHVAIEIKV